MDIINPNITGKVLDELGDYLSVKRYVGLYSSEADNEYRKNIEDRIIKLVSQNTTQNTPKTVIEEIETPKLYGVVINDLFNGQRYFAESFSSTAINFFENKADAEEFRDEWLSDFARKQIKAKAKVVCLDMQIAEIDWSKE